MKFHEARIELKRVLNEQQTISVPKLRRLLNSMNVSLADKRPRDIEIEYLKSEIKKLKREG